MSTRTVLVTGAARGIGRAIVVRLARSGWRVYGGVRTDVAAKELAAASDMITPIELDVTVPEHVDGARPRAPREAGRVGQQRRHRCRRPTRDTVPGRHAMALFDRLTDDVENKGR